MNIDPKFSYSKEGGSESSIEKYIIGISLTRNSLLKPFYSGETIGQGTFGKVKLGTHILTGEKVVSSI